MATNRIVLVEVSVKFLSENYEPVAQGTVDVAIEDPEDINPRKLIEACQRAVSNAVETLQNNLDNGP